MSSPRSGRGARLALSLALLSLSALLLARRRRRRPPGAASVLDLVGRTPLLRLNTLSAATGCEVYGKCEFLNPGGSVKDRVALRILQEALASGALRPGGLACEGTAGSTGISLAMLCPALGLRCHVVLPDDAAAEKAATIRALGGCAQLVRPVPISHPGHFVNQARARAAHELATAGPGAALFCDQFESLANFRAHAEGTGPEVWAQTGGRVDAFVSAAGTGGTLAGCGSFLASASRGRCAVFLADPPGSSLLNYALRGVAFNTAEAEGRRTRHQVDTITEGVGLNRLTANFRASPPLAGAFAVSDAEAVAMARHLARAESLFLGSSAAVNCVGALRAALRLGPGHTVVTILCDGGGRHLSKFWSEEALEAAGLTPPPQRAGHELDWLLAGGEQPLKSNRD